MAGGGASTEGGGSSPSPEAGATAAPTARDGEEEDEEAGFSTSKDGDETASAKRRRGRQAIKMPDSAAVLARVTLSCKTEPREGGAEEDGGMIGTRRAWPCCWIYLRS